MNNNSYYIQGNGIPQSYYNSNKQGLMPGPGPRPMPGPGSDDRFGFFGPFLLGGLTGGLVAGSKSQNCCPPAPYPYYPPAPYSYYPPRPPYYY